MTQTELLRRIRIKNAKQKTPKFLYNDHRYLRVLTSHVPIEKRHAAVLRCLSTPNGVTRLMRHRFKKLMEKSNGL